MENVLVSLRSELGLSQASVARMVGISPAAVMRNEQAIYSKPSDRLVEFYALSGLLDRDTIYAAYDNYQEWRRHLSISEIGRPPLDPGGLFNWRFIRKISQIEFCKLYCVHPAVLAKFEKGEMSSVPEQLKEAIGIEPAAA
jgi:hypothetical protein